MHAWKFKLSSVNIIISGRIIIIFSLYRFQFLSLCHMSNKMYTFLHTLMTTTWFLGPIFKGMQNHGTASLYKLTIILLLVFKNLLSY